MPQLEKTKLVLKPVTTKEGKRTKRWVKPGEDTPKLIVKKPAESKEKKLSKDWTTDSKYKDKNGHYTPERLELHNKIGRHIFADAGESQKKPIAILMGGGTASGKSTLLKNVLLPHIKAEGQHIGVIDSDAIKEEIPEYHQFQKENVETGARRVHTESSDIAGYVMHNLADSKKNMVIDGTMKNPEKYLVLIDELKKKGYEVQMVIADVSIKEARVRASARAKKTGRVVPDEILLQSHIGVSSTFKQLQKKVDSYHVYDTTDGGKLIADNDGIKDKKRMNEFLNKKNHNNKKNKMEKGILGEAFEYLGVVSHIMDSNENPVTTGDPVMVNIEALFEAEEGDFSKARDPNELTQKKVTDKKGNSKTVWIKREPPKRWKNQDAFKYAQTLTELWGDPDTAIHGKFAVWEKKVGKITKTKVKDESIAHNFPMPHKDFLYSYMPLNDAQVKKMKGLIDDFTKVSGSIFFDPLKKEVGARCAMLSKNAVTLGFIEDGIKNSSVINKKEYSRRIKGNIFPSWYKDPLGEKKDGK